ncbi:phage virion morphogenesis protein [Delftia tsuruhatensis]|uniref:phage virion morphogenesis protein n=1 Tax=Delftia tsuruhatensis TaxID=180282 RepID=UPI00105457D5|nr:phage virion morphogenesis protein [Delftia tsuruhatensis]MDH2233102.1 phage virion morphogenesis protein [Delftia tsuruhatensis]TDF23017.1 virion morphogenesis protein [Delftia tsuruhatensis]DAP44349.1 MAG TPA: virion morphogenesis protein [Caudoviricetes sp.]
MLDVRIDDRAFVDYLERIQRRLGDLTPVMQDIGMEMEGRVSARFESRTDPWDNSWAPWEPATRESYPEDGNRRLLDRYGGMLESLSHSADANSVRVGFGDPVAVYHEWGTKHMARRGMVFGDPDAGTLADEDAAAVLDIISVWLDQA